TRSQSPPLLPYTSLFRSLHGHRVPAPLDELHGGRRQLTYLSHPRTVPLTHPSRTFPPVTAAGRGTEPGRPAQARSASRKANRRPLVRAICSSRVRLSSNRPPDSGTFRPRRYSEQARSVHM